MGSQGPGTQRTIFVRFPILWHLISNLEFTLSASLAEPRLVTTRGVAVYWCVSMSSVVQYSAGLLGRLLTGFNLLRHATL